MIYELVLRNFNCSLEFVFSLLLLSAFQLFTCRLCLQFSGLRMRNFTWNRFRIKNLLIDSLLTPIVESTYLNRDMCKFESSKKDESRWQSTDSSKAYRSTSAFNCLDQCHFRLLTSPEMCWDDSCKHQNTQIYPALSSDSIKKVYSKRKQQSPNKMTHRSLISQTVKWKQCCFEVSWN